MNEYFGNVCELFVREWGSLLSPCDRFGQIKMKNLDPLKKNERNAALKQSELVLLYCSDRSRSGSFFGTRKTFSGCTFCCKCRSQKDDFAKFPQLVDFW